MCACVSNSQLHHFLSQSHSLPNLVIRFVFALISQTNTCANNWYGQPRAHISVPRSNSWSIFALHRIFFLWKPSNWTRTLLFQFNRHQSVAFLSEIHEEFWRGKRIRYVRIKFAFSFIFITNSINCYIPSRWCLEQYDTTIHFRLHVRIKLTRLYYRFRDYSNHKDSGVWFEKKTFFLLF